MKKKQFRGRFVKGFVVLTAMILVSLLCACTEKETPEDKALQEAENWVKTNYEQIYEVRNLHVPIFEQGKCVYESPDIETIKKYCQEQMETLWDETLRFENPQTYYVDLSQKLWDMKNRLLQEHAAE